MTTIDLTNNINRCEALIQQYQNSELYTDLEKEKRIAALKIEITRYNNQLAILKNNSVEKNININNIR
jgi:uncharacterized small protein (DUF1192 family)